MYERTSRFAISRSSAVDPTYGDSFFKSVNHKHTMTRCERKPNTSSHTYLLNYKHIRNLSTSLPNIDGHEPIDRRRIYLTISRHDSWNSLALAIYVLCVIGKRERIFYEKATRWYCVSIHQRRYTERNNKTTCSDGLVCFTTVWLCKAHSSFTS